MLMKGLFPASLSYVTRPCDSEPETVSISLMPRHRTQKGKLMLPFVTWIQVRVLHLGPALLEPVAP